MALIPARSTLSRRLSLGLLGVLALVLLVAVIPAAVVVNRVQQSDLREAADTAAAHLAGLVEGALWDVDMARATQIARAFAADASIAWVSVREENARTESRIPNTDGAAVVVAVRPVMHGAQRVGEVRVAFDQQVARQRLLAAVGLTVSFTLIAVLGLLIGGRLLLRHWLERPLEALSVQVSRYASGDYTDPGHDAGDGELREISAVLRAMGRQITSQLQSLRAEVEERRRAELRLRLVAAAMEATANAIVITDTKGEIEYVNPAFASMTGYSPAEAIGENPRTLVRSGRQDDAFYQIMWTTISRGETWTGQLVNRRKDGTFYTEEMTITPVRDQTGATTHYVAVKQDITSRLALEAQYRQAQKMESVGRLVGGVAHDFNNMLGVILGTAEYSLQYPDGGLSRDDALRDILQAAQRSAALTRQLLTFARRQEVQPTTVNLSAAVTDATKMLGRMIGEQILLTTTLEPAPWPVLADPSQVDQLLANLCINARDAIADVGTVNLSTANVTLDAAACAGRAMASPGDWVRLSVRDTGCGMSDETLQRAFEPFFTTKPMGEGTGLGLATVYGIVTQQSGFIEVSSTLGEGSCFDVYLPRHAGAARGSDAELTGVRRAIAGETVLLVEDEPLLLQLVTRQLQLLGYTVLDHSAPGAALHFAEHYDGRIDLLVSDLIMPDMNGKDLAVRLRKIRPNLPVLFMSGFSGSILDAHRDVVGDDAHFMAKPFTLEGLGAKMRHVLDQAART